MEHVETLLPPALADAWSALDETGLQLAAALEAGDLEQSATLAAERHRLMTQFFEHYPATAANAAARVELLRELVAANGRMLEAGRVQLREAAQLAAAGEHSRRAIRAYRERSATES
jgi:ABC-type uncharacterized transport system YnjBCD ATPase subunit